jgi:soluble lytic murein transglycosylase-like protein
VNNDRLRNLTPRDLYDPAVNLLLASFLIAQYNVEFDGRLDLVVAAWNAGKGAVKNGRPPAYGETLDLIGKVNAYFVFFLQQQDQRPVAVAR